MDCGMLKDGTMGMGGEASWQSTTRIRLDGKSTMVQMMMTEETSRIRSATSNSNSLTTTATKMTRRMMRSLEGRSSRRKHMGDASFSFLQTILATIILFTTMASAARIKSFSNCLSEKVINSPTHLQFHPLHVAAAFGDSGDHNLAITVWGNVTGRSSDDPKGTKDYKPPASKRTRLIYGRAGGLDDGFSSPFWKREEPEVSAHLEPLVSTKDMEKESTEIVYETTGVIDDMNPAWPKKEGNSVATTLVTKVSVLNYIPASGAKRFCYAPATKDEPENLGAECPLRPALVDLSIPYNISTLPSFNIKHAMGSGYPFASINVQARLVSGSEDIIGCVQIEIAPSLGDKIAATLRWLPFAILLLVATGTILAAVYNPWNGTTDIFRWSSNSGMDEDMLRLVTPGFGDCLQYLQFIVLTGSLTLSYPGFYQPAVSQAAWSALLFNTTFVSDHGRSRLIDNVYAPNGTTGFEDLSQLVGLGGVQDIWPCFMVYFAIVVGAVLVGCTVLSLVRVVQIKFFDHQEEDLRSKRWPFFGGMIIRLVFNYLCQPLVAFSAFQLVVTGKSPVVSPAIAGLVLGTVLIGAGACLYRIAVEKPRHALYDQLETLLLLGPLYNTYSEKSTLFCFVQVIVLIFRSLALGAAQPSGIAQLVLLAICEIILILTLIALRPFSPRTSMNLYYAFFSVVRLLAVLFSVAFIPSLEVDTTAKGWVGYVILILHGIVLVFGFFLNAVQTIIEVLLRMTGVGDDGEGASRGALVQVFGMRQLSRRRRKGHLDGPQTSGHEKKPSATTMSDMPVQSLLETNSNSGSNQHGHSRSGSAVMTPITPNSGMTLGLTGAAAKPAIGGLRINTETDSSTPFYRAPRIRSATLGGINNDPYSPGSRSRASWGSQDWGVPRIDASGNMITPAGSNTGRISANPAARNSMVSFTGSKGPGDGLRPYSDDWDVPTAINTNPHSGSGTPSQLPGPGPSDGASRYEPSISGAGRPKDYFTTRESDFYYGVSRGPPLNNHAQNRRVGTGPADPTGPISVAKSWFRKALGKTTSGGGHKGFEVVRSAKAPEELLKAMEADAKAKRAAQADPAAPESASLAQNQDPDSDAEDNVVGKLEPGPSNTTARDVDDDGEGYPTDSGRLPDSDAITALPAIHLGARPLDADTPPLPRRSSKRRSQAFSPTETKSLLLEVDRPTTAHSRLPFSGAVSETSSNGASHSHSRSQSFNSTNSGVAFNAVHPGDIALSDATARVKRDSGRDSTGQRPASMGNVQRHRMHDSLRVPPEGLNTGSSAELVDASGRPSESDDAGGVR